MNKQKKDDVNKRYEEIRIRIRINFWLHKKGFAVDGADIYDSQL